MLAASSFYQGNFQLPLITERAHALSRALKFSPTIRRGKKKISEENGNTRCNFVRKVGFCARAAKKKIQMASTHRLQKRKVQRRELKTMRYSLVILYAELYVSGNKVTRVRKLKKIRGLCVYYVCMYVRITSPLASIETDINVRAERAESSG